MWYIFWSMILFGALLLMIAMIEAKTLFFTHHSVKVRNLPKSFEDFTMMVISDLHCRDVSKYYNRILQKIQENKIDIILLLGDMVGDRRDFSYNDPTNFFALCDALKEYPRYYITGNHEKYVNVDALKKELRMKNVIVMENTILSLQKGAEMIYLAGLEHPKVNQKNFYELFSSLEKLEGVKILLSHVPKFWFQAVRAEADLMLCGHTHGGQIRLPIVGALYIPDQGWFPKHDQGWFRYKKSQMFISRGVGTTGLQMRFLCPPEISILRLRHSQKST